MRNIVYVMILMASIMTSLAQEAFKPVKDIPLYPNDIPNSKPTPRYYIEKLNIDWITIVSNPTLIPYFPAKGTANGTAIIIFPGGGYEGLSMVNEGYNIAMAFNKIGITAFVVKYRLPADTIMLNKTIGPLQDAQQAILMVRKHAAEWGLNPTKVGIIGFSAGGHLASTLGTHFDRLVVENKDNLSARPDFMILLYPVITFGEKTHGGSRDALIGKTPPQNLVDLYSNEKQVNANTPPTLLIHAEDDDLVPVENSLLFYNALIKNKVKAEMHLFQAGGHGFGLNNPKSKDKWMDWCNDWMKLNGFL